jgi:hypothetical protein
VTTARKDTNLLSSKRPGPLQNRVDPFGELHAVSARGAFMGNRGGRLHRDDGTLVTRRWTSRRWIICVCEFKGRRRDVWGEGYTELFFLDEPTALAAGHRPCFECRRTAAKAFLACFPGAAQSADSMDDTLHSERVVGRQKRLWRTRLGALPNGAMVSIEGRPHAVREGALLPWSFAGYDIPAVSEPGREVDVLTPPSTVAALAAGYNPQWVRA